MASAKFGGRICMTGATLFLRSSDSSSEAQDGDNPMSAFVKSMSLEEAERIIRPGTVAKTKAYFESCCKKEAVEKSASLKWSTGSSTVAERKAYFEACYKGEAVEKVAVLLPEASRVAEIDKVAFVKQKSVGNSKTVGSEQEDRDIMEAVYTAGVKRDDGVKIDESSREQQGSDYREKMQAALGLKVKKGAESSSTQLETIIRAPKPSRSTSGQMFFINLRDLTSEISKFKKPVADIIGKWRLTSKLLDFSVDLTSHTSQRIETSCLMPEQNRDRKTSIVPKRSPFGSQNPTMVSVSGILKRPPARPQCRRSNAQLSKSMIRGENSVSKFLSFPVNSSSNPTGSNARYPTIFSPFRFRAEERAEKQKQWLEEKTKGKGEKIQFLTRSKVFSVNSSSNPTGSNARHPTIFSPFRFRTEERAAKRKQWLEEKTKGKEGEKIQFQTRSKVFSVNSSSNPTGSNARRPTIFSPFRFRTEERAAKRKQWLDEKTKGKEGEKTQFQTRSKEKAEQDPGISDEANSPIESSSSKGKKPLEDSKKTADILVDALKETGERGIIDRGWGNLRHLMEVQDNVFLLEECPHNWLFPQCSAVVLHVGAGTTATGFRAGCPTTTVFFGDQFFWGDRIHLRGSPIPILELSFEVLSSAISSMLQPEVTSRATEIANLIQNEDGVTSAV